MPEAPASWNRYAYAKNSPLNYLDPNGLFPFQSILWNGVKTGWGWTTHILPKHVAGLIPGGSLFRSEAVARAATSAVIAAPDKMTRQGATRWLLQKATPGVGTQGQGVTRVVLEDLGGGTAALITSHPAAFMKMLAAIGIGLEWISDPVHSAEAAGPEIEEDAVRAQAVVDTKFSSSSAESILSTASTAGKDEDRNNGAARVVKVCDALGCTFQIR